MTKRSPFKYFKTSPEIIRLAVMLYVRFPLSLRNVEDLLHERGIEISHETVRFWWQRFGPMFASEIRKRRIAGLKSSRWQWHLDEVFVKVNGERHYLWRAVDHEGEVLESFVTKMRDKKAALKFLRKAMRKHGRPEVVVTDRLRSYGAALKEIGAMARQETGRWLNNRAENSHLPFRRRERAMQRAPARARGWTNLALAYALSGQGQLARNALRRSWALSANSAKEARDRVFIVRLINQLNGIEWQTSADRDAIQNDLLILGQI